MIEIEINNIRYISVGTFMDNNDGIMYYWPEKNDRWQDFFSAEEPIVILWTISYLEYEDFKWDETLHKLHNFISKNTFIISFLKKFCWNHDLESMFIDFVFGEYSSYGDQYLPEIIYEDKLIDPDYFEFDDHVFIEKNRYEEFIKALDHTCNLIINQLD